MAAWMPILGRHDTGEKTHERVDRIDDGIAVGHGERAARAEIGLDIDDEQEVRSVDPGHANGSFRPNGPVTSGGLHSIIVEPALIRITPYYKGSGLGHLARVRIPNLPLPSASGGYVLPVSDGARGTSARIEIGVVGPAAAGGLFLSGWGELGDTSSYGLRAGLRF